MTAITQRVELIAIYAGLAGIFQAGLDLVFFDELMKTVPLEYSATLYPLCKAFSISLRSLLHCWERGW